VTIFRRATGWQSEIYAEPAARVELRSIDQTLALAAIYDGVALA
jgi:hypothetical protein